MNKMIRTIFTLVILLVLLSGCGPKPNIIGNMEESKIIVNEKLDLITFFSLIENTGTIPSNTLYAKFEIGHEQLATELGDSTIVFSNDGQIPRSFTISGESGYFISESYTYETSLPLEELVGVVDVVVFDENGEEISRFTIQKVEKE